MAKAPISQSASSLDRELRDMNEALVVSSIHHQERAEQAQRAEAAVRRSEAELRVHSEELARFNRVAVGRELRMIELKQEVNEFAHRCGEQARYAPDVESGDTPNAADTVRSDQGTEDRTGRSVENNSVPLESILLIEELTRRPQRAPDYESENRALASLVQALAGSGAGVLQVLAEKIREVLRADSAGISLLTQDERRFYWAAIAGVWKPHIGGGTPRDFGPCADVLRSNKPLLFKHFERRYEYLWPVTPPVEEGLFVPFYVEGRAVGALWAFSHNDRKFDAEDLRQLESLGRFGAAAYLEQSRRAAALNLTEDAVLSRRTMESVFEALRSSEERYRTLFTSIDEGFCVIEMLFDHDDKPVDYVFLETNPAFEKQTGLQGAVGHRIRELSPTHAPRWFETFGQVASRGEPVRFINQAEDFGGRWFDVYAFRLGEPGSHKLAILFNDISERKRLEGATQEYANSLATLNRRKDEFLAMLSHELRNPLASLLNAAQVLRLERDRSPLQIEAHGIIDRQVSQLGRLVDDLLEVSRISTGRIRLHMERVDLGGIARRAIDTMRSQANSKAQSIAALVPDGPLWVSGDPLRLEQVVVNLLNNAIKYTDRGGDIGVALEAEEDEAVLRVRDNGVGIAPEVLPHIFDLFTQADTSLDRAQGGLGIGLALVQSLVIMHRGRVEVHSTLHHGSEFVVRLPMLEPSAADVSLPDIAEPGSAPLQALKILVVDDNLDAAQSLAMLLQARGHDARVAHDGAGAMKAAMEYIPDVMLLDIGLPIVDGLQVAAWIRGSPVLKHVVMVAMTGYGRESDRQRGKEAGFEHYLVKPVNIEEVESILSFVDTKVR